MTKTKYTLLFLIGFLVSGCNKNDQVAAYVTIEPFEYTPGEDNIMSTKITDGWVYVDNEFLGAFDLPKTIPVLKSGENSIVIDAGIKENGIAATPDLYTFYERYSTTVNLVPGEKVIVSPSTTYDNTKTNLIFDEFFEDGTSHQFENNLDGNDNTEIVFTSEVVKEGNQAGKIYLDTENNFIIEGSDYIENPPSSGLTAYIEMDYKTDIPIFVGLRGYGSADQLVFSEINLGINAKSEWNKIYLNVTDKLQSLAIAGATKYRIVIQAQIPTENGENTMENAEIYIDNIKLVSL